MVLDHEYSFAEVIESVQHQLAGWRSDESWIMDLDQYTDAIYLKNFEMELVLANRAYKEMFFRYPIGQRGHDFLNFSVSNVSIATDAVIQERWIKSIQFDHVGIGIDGKVYEFLTFKQTVVFDQRGVAMLGISRRVLTVGCEDAAATMKQFEIYSEFGDENKAICWSLSLGHSTTQIANDLRLSLRTVQGRIKSILSSLDLDRHVDIVKMLVRFEDRGHK